MPALIASLQGEDEHKQAIAIEEMIRMAHTADKYRAMQRTMAAACD